MTDLVAIDFETADHGRDSACAVGAVKVQNGRLTERFYSLIRPPRRAMLFTAIHGLTWDDVAGAPPFAEVWPDLRDFIGAAPLLAAHNAGFDRAVLAAGCHAMGLASPATPFLCTVRLARAAWGVRPTRLPDVCRYLAISLDHHHALSDAEACGEIAAAAWVDGFPWDAGLLV